jgi:hypothetical protein
MKTMPSSSDWLAPQSISFSGQLVAVLPKGFSATLRGSEMEQSLSQGGRRCEPRGFYGWCRGQVGHERIFPWQSPRLPG